MLVGYRANLRIQLRLDTIAAAADSTRNGGGGASGATSQRKQRQFDDEDNKNARADSLHPSASDTPQLTQQRSFQEPVNVHGRVADCFCRRRS